MRERNLCHESGCPDLCCVNSFSKFTKEELEQSFPVTSDGSIYDNTNYLDEGVYVLKETGDGKILVFTKGRCPNNADGCIASPKPEFCKGHEFAGERCNEFRKEEGLPQISIDSQGEIVYLPPKKKTLIFCDALNSTY
jgi:hypothetical protein